MTDHELREELRRIAEDAPVARVDDGLYARGRRSAQRRRVAVAGAAVACIALVAGLLVPRLGEDEAPVADAQPVVGVPDRIFLPPTSVTDDRSDDFAAVELGAAAFVTESGAAVVVSAVDGSYHVLDLGMAGGDSMVDLTDPAVALSPDGTRLAWGFAEPGDVPEDRRVTGLRVAELGTGEVREVRLDVPPEARPRDVGAGVLVDQVAWSPNSRWLAWHGQQARTWTATEFVAGPPVAGAIAAEGSASSYHRVPEAQVVDGGEVTAGDVPSEVAVSSSGQLAVLAGDTLWEQGERRAVGVRADETSGGLWFGGKDLRLLLHRRTGGEARVLDLATGESVSVVAISLESPRLVGTRPHGDMLLHQEEPDGDADAGWVQRTGLRHDSGGALIEVDAGITRLTLASRLIDDRHPTVSRPAPEWPMPTEQKVAIGALVGGGVGVLMLGWCFLRRRRSRTLT